MLKNPFLVYFFSFCAVLGIYQLDWSEIYPSLSYDLLLFFGLTFVFALVLADGVSSGELSAHDTATVAAALVGALGEALVGPLGSGGDRHSDALVATLVQFCLASLPTVDRPVEAT